MADTEGSGPDVNSPASPHRQGVWCWVDPGAISGKVSPSVLAPSHLAQDLSPSFPPLPFLRLTALHKPPFLHQAFRTLPSHPLPPRCLPSLPSPTLSISSSSPSPGQILSATQEQIAESYYPEYLINLVQGQLQTRQASSMYDDSYLGE